MSPAAPGGSPSPRRSPRAALLAVMLLALAGLLGLSGCASTTATTAASTTQAASPTRSVTAKPTRPASKPASRPATAQGSALAPASPTTNLPTVRVAELPPQAQQTLALIAAGGPYPYAKDGVTFGNRERLLPSKPNGFYTEYTVITPGSSDRGARRIVAGENGSRFYTADHYASFREVIS